MNKPRNRIWLGISLNNTTRELFNYHTAPTFRSHGDKYICAIGPFRTKKGAEFMRDHGSGNPHCQSVNQAEHIAAGESYDIVLRKWIKKSGNLVKSV